MGVTSSVSIMKKAPETPLNHYIAGDSLGDGAGGPAAGTPLKQIWNWPRERPQMISRGSGFMHFVIHVKLLWGRFAFSVSTHANIHSHVPDPWSTRGTRTFWDTEKVHSLVVTLLMCF